jgi:hypothetical protein
MAFIPNEIDYTNLVLNHLVEYKKVSQGTHIILRIACDKLAKTHKSDPAQVFALVTVTLADILLNRESELKKLTQENEEMKNRIQDITESKSHRTRVMENTSE